MDLKLIKEKIEQYNTILIFRHVMPDGDAYGSTFGLKQLIMDNYPDKKVYCLGDKSDVGDFFGKLDTIKDEEAKDSLSICLDVPNIDRVDGKQHQFSKELIKIDHHIYVETYADIEWIDTTASSTCELITILAVESNWKISEKSATFLYFGTTTDANRFLYTYTPRLFKMMAVLMEANPDVESIYKFIYETTQESTRFHGFCQANFQTTGYGVAYNKLTPEVLEKYGIDRYKGAGMVNSLANMKNIHVWCHFSENEDGTVRGEIRSKGYPVNTVANEFGGGGHKQAAGCTLLNWDEVEKCIQKCDDLCRINLPYFNELENAKRVIREAGKITMEYYNRGFDVEIKDDDSPVTTADKLSDSYIRKELSILYPEYGILSEETDDNLDRLNKEFVWIIDPIDGTKDFIAHDDQFAINIALSKNHQIVLGLIYVPAKDILYFAVENGGAYKEENGTTKRIFTSEKTEELTALVSHFHLTKKDEDFLVQFSKLITKKESVGSAYKYGLIAEGKADINVKFSDGTKEWDIAPGVIIIKEAKGSFTKPDGSEYEFNRKDVYNKEGYIVLNKFNKGFLK